MPATTRDIAHRSLREVTEIIGRRHEGNPVAVSPSLDSFKARTQGGNFRIIRHNARSDTWAIILPVDQTGTSTSPPGNNPLILFSSVCLGIYPPN